MSTRICASCGKPIPENGKFCIQCGAPAPTEPVPAPAPVPVSPEPASVPSAPACTVAPPSPSGPVTEPLVSSSGPVTEPLTPFSDGAAEILPPLPPLSPAPDPQVPPAAVPLAMAETVPAKDSKYAPISIGGYMGILLLLNIPIVGFILTIVWACGGCKKVNKQNLARALLIFWVIGLVLSVVLGLIFWLVFQSLLQAAGVNVNDFAQLWEFLLIQ